MKNNSLLINHSRGLSNSHPAIEHPHSTDPDAETNRLPEKAHLVREGKYSHTWILPRHILTFPPALIKFLYTWKEKHPVEIWNSSSAYHIFISSISTSQVFYFLLWQPGTIVSGVSLSVICSPGCVLYYLNVLKAGPQRRDWRTLDTFRGENTHVMSLPGETTF